jgi:hypothetical protein
MTDAEKEAFKNKFFGSTVEIAKERALEGLTKITSALAVLAGIESAAPRAAALASEARARVQTINAALQQAAAASVSGAAEAAKAGEKSEDKAGSAVGPETPSDAPSRGERTAGWLVPGLTLSLGAMVLMVLAKPFVILGSALLGLGMGARFAYKNPKPWFGNKFVEAAVIGLGTAFLGLFSPPAVAFLFGATYLGGRTGKVIHRLRAGRAARAQLPAKAGAAPKLSAERRVAMLESMLTAYDEDIARSFELGREHDMQALLNGRAVAQDALDAARTEQAASAAKAGEKSEDKAGSAVDGRNLAWTVGVSAAALGLGVLAGLTGGFFGAIAGAVVLAPIAMATGARIGVWAAKRLGTYFLNGLFPGAFICESLCLAGASLSAVPLASPDCGPRGYGQHSALPRR